MTTVTLHDGREVPSDSEEWRCECEAKAALRLDLSSRRAYLEDIERKRGKPAADVLKARIVAIWTKGRV
jgi:hypothetical protein